MARGTNGASAFGLDHTPTLGKPLQVRVTYGFPSTSTPTRSTWVLSKIRGVLVEEGSGVRDSAVLKFQFSRMCGIDACCFRVDQDVYSSSVSVWFSRPLLKTMSYCSGIMNAGCPPTEKYMSSSPVFSTFQVMVRVLPESSWVTVKAKSNG